MFWLKIVVAALTVAFSTALGHFLAGKYRARKLFFSEFARFNERYLAELSYERRQMSAFLRETSYEGEFEKALEASKQIFAEYPDVTAVMCGNDQLAVGAKTAANLAEIEQVIIYGVDGSPDIKKELKKPGNQIAGTAAQSPINMGKTAAEIGIDILEGKDYDTETFEEVFMIDADNVDMYGVDGWQ